MILKYNNKTPVIDEEAFVVEDATLVGEVCVGPFSSIWFYAVLRADLDLISIGHHTSVQDGAVIHVGHNLPTKVGNYVTIGHGAILHGCEVGDHCLIGSGANVLDHVTIGKYSIIAAGTIVTPHTVIPDKVMVMGIPGKIVRKVTEKEIMMIEEHADSYVKLIKDYKDKAKNRN